MRSRAKDDPQYTGDGTSTPSDEGNSSAPWPVVNPQPEPDSSLTSRSSGISEAHPAGPLGTGPLQSGTVIGDRYEVERFLGRGGMGTVYLAHDRKLALPVALKLMHRELTLQPAQIRRFKREAEILRRLANRHTVRVYDYGQTAAGELYLAMEYLVGETLAQQLDRCGTLAPALAVRIALAVLDGLAAAHQLGIIHRDVKPANIYLVAQGDKAEPEVKLLDFGLAKDSGADTSLVTASGTLLGTPRYMSPERLLGLPFDARDDLYSLGVVLYRMLTGVTPYEHVSTVPLVYALHNAPPIPPEQRVPTVSPALGQIVMRALARMPDERYPDARAMATELGRVLSLERTERLTRASRAVAPLVRGLVVACVLCTLLAGLEFPLAVRAPFPGFAVESGMLVSSLTHPEWEALKDKLRPYDHILAVDGKAMSRARMLYAYVAERPLGTPVRYHVRRHGKEFDVTVPVARLSWHAMLVCYGPLYLVGFLLVAIGGIVAWARAHEPGALGLLAFTASFGLSFLLSHDLDLYDRMPEIWRLSLALQGAAAIHLGLVYPEPWVVSQRRPWLLALIYLPGLCVFALWQHGAAEPSIGEQSTRLSQLMILLGSLGLFARLFYVSRRGKLEAARRAARRMLWAALVSMIPLLLSAIVFSAGIFTEYGDLYGLSVVPMALFPMVIAYQLWRGQIFDFTVVLAEFGAKAMRYLISGVLFGGVAVIVLGAAHWVGADPMTARLVGVILGMVAVIAAQEPISRALANRRGHAKRPSDAALLAEFAAASSFLRHKDDILDLLFDRLRQRFNPSSIRLLVAGSKGYQAREIESQAEDFERPAVLADISYNNTSTGMLDSISQPLTPVLLQQAMIEQNGTQPRRQLVLPLESAHSPATSRESALSFDSVSLTAAERQTVVVLGRCINGRAYNQADITLATTMVQMAAACMAGCTDP